MAMANTPSASLAQTMGGKPMTFFQWRAIRLYCLRNARNLDKIWAVFLNGKYFSKAALEKLKSDVAAGYAGQSVNAGLGTAMDSTHTH